MKLEKGNISSTQLMFTVACFIQGSVLLTAFIIGVSKQDTWISVIMGYLFALPVISLYLVLVKRFPGKNLIQIHDIAFGPVIGKLFSALYIFFLISLASFNTWDVGTFIIEFIMPETPVIVIIVMFLFVCALAVRGGD